MQLLDHTEPPAAPPSAQTSAAPVSSPARRSPRRPRAAGPRPPKGMGRAIALAVAPGLILFTTFFFLPLLVLIATALGDWGGHGFTYLGLDNFSEIFADDKFWQATRNTAYYCAAGVLIQVPLGILVGILLAQRRRGWRFFRAVIFIPFVISGAAYALIFTFVYNPRYGLLNSGLDVLGLNQQHDWLHDSSTALMAIVGAFVFVIGFIVVLVMAEIASIPGELYEAAEIDGASGIQRQWYITLPLLRNVIGTLLLIRVLNDLALFDLVYILTSGGPNDATISLSLYAYQAYTNGAWGYANAVGVVIVVVGLVFIVGIRRLFRIGDRSA